MSKTIYCLAFFVGFTDSLVGGQPLYIGTWGERGAGDGQFHAPQGMAVDSNDNVYIADTSNDRIQKFDRNGNYLDQWGTSGSGGGQLDQPYAIALDSAGNIYVTEGSNNLRVQKFDSAGGYLATWEETAPPRGIAIDSSDNVFIANGDQRIRKTTDTGSLLTEWGSSGSGDGQFSGPTGVGVDSSGNVYVLDIANRVQKFTSTGTYLAQWGGDGSGDGQFTSPNAIAVSQNGIVYVLDVNNDRIHKFAADGTYLGQWGTQGTGPGQISHSSAVLVSQKGDVYSIDEEFNEVNRWFDVDALLPGQIADFESLRIYSDASLGDALTLATNKHINVSTITAVELGATLTLAGGSLTTSALDNAGQIDLDSGVLTITGLGGIIIGPSGQITTLSLSSGRTLDVTNVTTVVTGGVLAVTDGIFSSDTLKLDGGTVSAPDLSGVSNLQVNAGTISLSGNSSPVRVSGNNPGAITINGNLSLGDGTRFDGYDHQGTLAVGTHQVTLQSAGFANLGILTTLDGGELIAVNGVTLGVGDTLTATGEVNAKIVQSAGSIIVATGDLALGDNNSFAGFISDGELRTGIHTVTLLVANQAILGPLTEIGSGGMDGTLSASNGILLEEGKMLVGQGNVNTAGDEFKNEGLVQGDGTGIKFNHLVTGAGNFGGNVAFNGGFTPGEGPALIGLENVTFSGTNILTINIGGVDKGTEYVALNVSGTANLGGTLSGSLLNLGGGTFVPTAGDSFEILSAAGGISGTFDGGVSLPPLTGDLTWEVIYDTENYVVTLDVLTPYPGDFDGNGMVDNVDLTLLLDGWGGAPGAGWANNPPATVGNDSLTLLLDDWGQPLQLGAVGVPEPSCLAIALLATMSGLAVQRRILE